jgi:hypothetical protein
MPDAMPHRTRAAPVRAVCIGALLCLWPAAAQAQVDPLTAVVDTSDADRFAAIFARTNGRPSAADLQRDYLDKGSEGVRIFTPGRIENAQALADHVAANGDQYRRAIDHCLPLARQATGDLRAIYLALHGLYPDRPLPAIHIVFGRGNSGGTAGPGAQVLGLEVLCDPMPTPEAFRERLRTLFAHETVHTWQNLADGAQTNRLLRAVLIEGAADYVASLVLGRPPSADQQRFGTPREAELWAQFQADVATTRPLADADYATSKAGQAAVQRWVGNYQSAPEGWPYEMGYWIGMRIWQRHVAAAPNKRAALEEVLRWTDPEAIRASGALQPEKQP